MNKKIKIAIIGVGLIGGSIASGLKRVLGKKVFILGQCSTHKRSLEARKRYLIDQVLTKPDLTKNIDLIIIATPIHTSIKILLGLNKILPRNTLVIDVGSVKGEICSLGSNLGNIQFCGTHPMAGSENSGFEKADSYLFYNKPWVICPDKKNRIKKQKFLLFILKLLGARIITLDPKVHDEQVAWGSHLNLVISSIIVTNIFKNSRWDIVSRLASTGYRDSTRLASFNPQLKTEIISQNKENIAKILRITRDSVDSFINILEKNDPSVMETYFEQGKKIRELWLTKYFS